MVSSYLQARLHRSIVNFDRGLKTVTSLLSGEEGEISKKQEGHLSKFARSSTVVEKN